MTRSRIIYILLLIGSIIYVSFYGGRVSYGLFYLLLMLPFFCLLYTLYTSIFLKFYQNVSHGKTIKSEPAFYEYTIHNEGLLPFVKIQVCFKNDYSDLFLLGEGKEYTLLPGTHISEQSELICRYRGEYSVGIDHFCLTDPFGLIRLTFPMKEPLMVKVFPRIISWQYKGFLLSSEDEKSQSSSSFQHDEPDAELRTYQPGDSLKQIHWKASAKSSTLLVHKYHDRNRQELMIIPDLTDKSTFLQEKLISEDQLIEELLSLSNEGLRQFIPVHIITKDSVEFRILCQQDLDLFYEFCAKVSFSDIDTYVNTIQGSLRYFTATTQLFLLTTTLSKELINALLYVQPQVGSITLFLTKTDVSEEQVDFLSFLSGKGINIIYGGNN